jgi:hypothetical protein
MEPSKSFKIKAQLIAIDYDEGSYSWTFQFSDNISLVVESIWRLFCSERISFISLDHAQMFGHTEPVDLIAKLTQTLSGKMLVSIEFGQEGDLLLRFTDELWLQVLVTSTGYESFSLSMNGHRYIGLGGGDIAIL